NACALVSSQRGVNRFLHGPGFGGEAEPRTQCVPRQSPGTSYSSYSLRGSRLAGRKFARPRTRPGSERSTVLLSFHDLAFIRESLAEVGLDFFLQLDRGLGPRLDMDGVVVGEIAGQLRGLLLDPEPVLDIGQGLLALGQSAVIDGDLALGLAQPH